MEGTNITYYKCDLSDMEEIKRVMARVREENGSLSVLGNVGRHSIYFYSPLNSLASTK